MATWYRTHYEKISPVEVTKATAQSVFLADGRRRAKVSHSYGNESYHPTWAEARDCLLARAEYEVRNARIALDRANGFLGNIKGLREPQP